MTLSDYGLYVNHRIRSNSYEEVMSHVGRNRQLCAMVESPSRFCWGGDEPNMGPAFPVESREDYDAIVSNGLYVMWFACPRSIASQLQKQLTANVPAPARQSLRARLGLALARVGNRLADN